MPEVGLVLQGVAPTDSSLKCLPPLQEIIFTSQSAPDQTRGGLIHRPIARPLFDVVPLGHGTGAVGVTPSFRAARAVRNINPAPRSPHSPPALPPHLPFLLVSWAGVGGVEGMSAQPETPTTTPDQ